MDGEKGTATRIGVAGIVGKGKGDDVIDHHLTALVIPSARVILSVALQQIRPHDILLHFFWKSLRTVLSRHVAHLVDADTPGIHNLRTVLDCECSLESYAFCPEREKEISKSSMRRVSCSAMMADTRVMVLEMALALRRDMQCFRRCATVVKALSSTTIDLQ